MKSRMQKSVEEQKATEKDLNNLFKVAEIALLNTKEGEVIDFDMMLTETAYGKLTTVMQHAMHSYIKGRTVFDIGAGDLELSKVLLKMGAKQVVAIDKEMDQKKTIKGVKQFVGTFQDFLDVNRFRPGPNITAFISWPANHRMNGLLTLLSGFKTIVYLGKNTDGSACAWPGFFKDMRLRPVLEHIPHRRNTLIAWGPNRGLSDRELVLEEQAGLDQSKCYNFKEST